MLVRLARTAAGVFGPTSGQINVTLSATDAILPTLTKCNLTGIPGQATSTTPYGDGATHFHLTYTGVNETFINVTGNGLVIENLVITTTAEQATGNVIHIGDGATIGHGTIRNVVISGSTNIGTGTGILLDDALKYEILSSEIKRYENCVQATGTSAATTIRDSSLRECDHSVLFDTDMLASTFFLDGNTFEGGHQTVVADGTASVNIIETNGHHESNQGALSTRSAVVLNSATATYHGTNVHFGGDLCKDNFDTGGPPQTSGSPDGLCDEDGSTSDFNGGRDMVRTVDQVGGSNDRQADVCRSCDWKHGALYDDDSTQSQNSRLVLENNLQIDDGVEFYGNVYGNSVYIHETDCPAGMAAREGFVTGDRCYEEDVGVWYECNGGTDGWCGASSEVTRVKSGQFATSASCSPTTEGESCWETGTDILHVGDGSGTVEIGSGGSSEWTDTGTVVHPTETGDDVSIGSATLVNSSKLSIDGDADQVQVTVQANSTQTDSVVIVENSAGTEVANIDNDGNVLAQSIEDIDGPGTNWEVTAAGAATFTSVTTGSSATPSIDFDDSDDTGSVDASIDINCPTANDCDMAFLVDSGSDTEAEAFRIDTTDGGVSTVEFSVPLVSESFLDIGTRETFTDSDATPDVSTGSFFITNTTTFTITDFDGTGIDAGQIITVESNGAITYDCTASGFQCGSTDIVTAAGDLTSWLYDGTDWHLIAFTDQSTDMGTDATGGTPDFGSITTGTNTSATMTVGAGGSLVSTSTGIVEATRLVNGTAPTVDAAGEVAIDTTDSGVGGDQIVYYDGSAARALTDVFQECVTIEDLAAADDGKPIWMNTAYTDVTLISAACVCIGTCTTEADIGLDNEESGTPAALTGTITCEDTTTGDTNTAMSGAAATVDQYDVITMDVDNAVSPETDEYVLCLNFRPVVQ